MIRETAAASYNKLLQVRQSIKERMVQTLIVITKIKPILIAQIINKDLTRKLNEIKEIFSFFVVLYQCCCCQENVFKKIALKKFHKKYIFFDRPNWFFELC